MGRLLFLVAPFWKGARSATRRCRFYGPLRDGTCALQEDTEEMAALNQRNEQVIEQAAMSEGDAWTGYWKPYVVAAYRKHAFSREWVYPFSRREALGAITELCPPTKSHLDLDHGPLIANKRVGQIGHILTALGLSPIVELTAHREWAAESSPSVAQSRLFESPSAIHERDREIRPSANIPTDTAIPHDLVVRTAEMIKQYEPYLAYSEEDLRHTPYQHKGEDMYLDYAGNLSDIATVFKHGAGIPEGQVVIH